MLLRSTQSFLVVVLALALAACHAAPTRDAHAQDPHEQPDSNEQMAQLLMQQLNSQQERMMSWMLADRRNDSVVLPNDAPGIAELNTRLGVLTERLYDLIASLPQPTIAAVDATTRRSEHALARTAKDAARIETLTQAILVVEQVANACTENIANINTPAYKKRVVDITATIDATTGMQLPKIGRITILNTTGTLEIAERNLDVAIDDEGWFVVTRADGTSGYVRNGSLHINPEGAICSAEGYPLTPIVMIANDTLEICIDQVGRVTGRTASNPDQASNFGQLQLARFRDPHQLHPIENGMLLAPPECGSAIVGPPGANGLGYLKQGFLERSNVQLTNELVNLQVAQRQQAVLRRLLASYGVFLH